MGCRCGLGNLAKGSKQCELASTINQALIVLHVCVCVRPSERQGKVGEGTGRKRGSHTRRLRAMHHAAEIFL